MKFCNDSQSEFITWLTSIIASRNQSQQHVEALRLICRWTLVMAEETMSDWTRLSKPVSFVFESI